MEITKFSITRQQLKEKHFYYNGCTCSNDKNDTDNSEILDLAADVLIEILKAETSEE